MDTSTAEELSFKEVIFLAENGWREFAAYL